MLNSVVRGGALALLLAGPVLAQPVPSANIGSTIGADVQIGAPGSLGGSVLGSPLTPSSALPVNPGVAGSLTPPARANVPAGGALQAATPATSSGVDASAVANAPSNSPIVVGAVVRSPAGVQMGTIARLIPGPNGFVSGVVLRTPSGMLREAPISALGTSAGALVTTYNTAQINALPEAKSGQ